jgi:hypothetical protein
LPRQIISSRWKGIGKGYEFVGDAVVVQAAKHEEPAISGNDFARLKATIVPDISEAVRSASTALGGFFLIRPCSSADAPKTGCSVKITSKIVIGLIPLIIGPRGTHGQSEPRSMAHLAK